MKRKLLATLLALCLIVGMIPVAASAAEETVNTAAELTDALANAIDGDTIRLGDDIVLDPTYAIKNDEYTEEEKEDGPPIPYFTIDHSIVLDLNGHTISWDVEKVTTNSQDIWYTLLLFAVDGAEVTICGNGTIETEANYSNSYGINIVNNGSLTIENGTFTGATSAIQVQTGSLVITGGTFKQAKTIGSVASQYAKYVVNAIDANYKNGTAKIALKGGEYCYDYSNFPEGTNTTYVADGYVMETSSGETGMYTVSPKTEKTDNDVAVVDGQYFTQLQNAINAAERGETVALLKDTTENVTIASGKDLQLDLNGKTLTETTYMDVQGVLTIKDSTATSAPQISSDYETVTYQSGKIANTGTGILVSNGGKLTLESGCVHSTSGNGINVNGNTNMEGWDNAIDSSVTITGGYVHSREYGIGVYGNGAVVNVEGGVVVADDNGAIAGNGSYNSDSNGDGVTDNYGGTEINIRGGTVIGHIVSSGYIAVGIYHPQNGEMTISGGTIYADQGVGIAMRGGTLDFTGGSIISTGSASGKVGDSKVAMDCYGIQVDGDSGYYDYTNCKVTISGSASVSSQSGVDSIIVTPAGDEDKITVSGGYFTSDPSAYLADDLVAVPSDMPGYAFTVGEAVETEVEPAVGNPTVEMGNGIKDEDKDTIETVAKTVTAGSGELAAAANDMLKDADDSKEAAIKEYQNSEIEGASGANNVNVYAQTYLSVTPTDYDSTNKTLTMDITPMYRVVASTKDNPEDIKVVGEVEENEQPNAVVLENSEKKLNIRTMTITLTLPSGFVSGTENIYVQHKDIYEYTATVTVAANVYTATFTNPHGFSEFTFTTDSQAVATIGSTSYTSLQAAVDDATSDDIIVVKNGNVDLSATANKTVKVKNGTENNIKVTINGVSKTIEKNATETFVYTSGGGGTPSEPEEPTWPFEDVTEGDDWFYDAVAYVYENGIMAGTDETTFEPYMELDRAMAAQLFYNLEGKPAVTGDSTFTDVTSGHWAVDAITWAAENEVVAGIGEGLYDPDSNVTREQFAQMLYNYAKYKGYDLTATGDLSQFPDAGSISSWAETALSWANGKGLINGHENGTIDPKGSTIRGQAASIMANFDQNVAK